jgi:hypothetical protein
MTNKAKVKYESSSGKSESRIFVMFNKDCKLGNPAKSRNQWKNILTTYQSK